VKLRNSSQWNCVKLQAKLEASSQRSCAKLQAKLGVRFQWNYVKLLVKLGNDSLLGEINPTGLGKANN